jgi:predicted nucleotidyltransferase
MTREKQVLETIRSVFVREKEILAGRRVILFGSRASGKSRPRSDFDIGIEGEAPLNAASFAHLVDRLEKIDTLYRIDLVDMQTVPERFRRNATKQIKVIYE